MENLPQTHELPANEKQIGRYLLLEKIGQGGGGEVYKAKDTRLGRIIALKILLNNAEENSLRRFQREAKITAQLEHPNIVKLYDLDVHEDNVILAMEYVEGQALSQLLKCRSLPLERSCRIVLDVLGAIAVAHGKGFVHRDIKPSNILLDKNGKVFVTDFGLVKAFNSHEFTQLSHTGMILGTPAYMSPEQARANEKDAITPQSDLFSVGAMLYEMLTGALPFDGENPFNILFKLVNEAPPPPRSIAPGIPADLERICLKALEKDKSRRYSSAEEMAAEIRKFLKSPAASHRDRQAKVAVSQKKPSLKARETKPPDGPKQLPRSQKEPISPVVLWSIVGGTVILAAIFGILFYQWRETHLEVQQEYAHEARTVWEAIAGIENFEQKQKELEKYLSTAHYKGFPCYQQAEKEKLRVDREVEARQRLDRLLPQIAAEKPASKWKELRKFLAEHEETEAGKEVADKLQKREKAVLDSLTKLARQMRQLIDQQNFSKALKSYTVELSSARRETIEIMAQHIEAVKKVLDEVEKSRRNALAKKEMAEIEAAKKTYIVFFTAFTEPGGGRKVWQLSTSAMRKPLHRRLLKMNIRKFLKIYGKPQQRELEASILDNGIKIVRKNIDARGSRLFSLMLVKEGDQWKIDGNDDIKSFGDYDGIDYPGW